MRQTIRLHQRCLRLPLYPDPMSSLSTPIKDAKGNPIEGRVEHITIDWKGKFLAGGVSGIVERLSSGNVVKSPWPGLREANCRRDLTIEAAIYNKLPPHPRLVKLIHWDPDKCVLMLEYMPNGSLGEYLSAYNDTIFLPQRLQWIQEAAEGLQLLHSAQLARQIGNPAIGCHQMVAYLEDSSTLPLRISPPRPMNMFLTNPTGTALAGVMEQSISQSITMTAQKIGSPGYTFPAGNRS
jgi:hypothetical protein